MKPKRSKRKLKFVRSVRGVPYFYMDDELTALMICELARGATPPVHLDFPEVLRDVQAHILRDMDK